jgi:hypothetical protein
MYVKAVVMPAADNNMYFSLPFSHNDINSDLSPHLHVHYIWIFSQKTMKTLALVDYV